MRAVLTAIVGAVAMAVAVELGRRFAERVGPELETAVAHDLDALRAWWQYEQHVQSQVPYVLFEAYYATREAAPQ